ncbi:hypothetical protein PAEPH01_1540 [Pancytospora epiphaga]|nr:hypothetical protein PAEPH01_1540 [Pancytospora epiphaga]
MISESDVCLSHVVYSQQFSAVKPEIGDCIVIEHATNPLVPKSCFQDYFLSSFLNFNILTGQNMSGKSLYAKGLAYQIVLNQLGCFVGAKRASLPIFTGIYCIETVADINAVLSVLLNGRSDVLVIVDNLECSFCLQLTLAEVLLESGAIVIYITHCHTLPLYLQKYSNLNVIECVNYKVKDGLCKISNAEEICKDILPENVYKKWMNYRKLFYSKDLRL